MREDTLPDDSEETDLEVRLERLRSPEIGTRLANGWRTAIFAVGAVEQHGPHLPLFVDAEHGTALAVAVARKAGQTLVAPTVRVGCSDHHMDFPGSLTVRRSTFTALCTDYCTSLAHHGFEKIWIVPTHGGNFAPLIDMLTVLEEAVAPRVQVAISADMMQLMECWTRVTQEETGLGERVGGHADISETSLMMHLHPDLVREDLAVEGFRPAGDLEDFRRIIAEGFQSVTPTGILGDARGGTPELGRALIEALADLVLSDLRRGPATNPS